MARRAVKSRLRAIAQRRAFLSAEIEQQRFELRQSAGVLTQELAFAGLGLVVGRILVRRPWLRALALGGLAAFASRKMAIRR